MLSPAVLDALVDRVLAEDSGRGDVTTEAIVPPRARARGAARAKSPQVVCGLELAERVFRRVDPGVLFEAQAREGASVARGAELFRVEGDARALLAAERPALNLLQRLGGVATLTQAYVAALPPGSTTRIADTRKTTPGLRAIERYAVRVGGGHNHRDDLAAGILIKDNHIALAGGVARAIDLARRSAPHTLRIEVEVATIDMLEQALAANAEIVMLDNFRPEEVASAVARARGRALVEVSGNVTVERVAELAAAGVDVISVGALTHSAPAADISLALVLS